MKSKDFIRYIRLKGPIIYNSFINITRQKKILFLSIILKWILLVSIGPFMKSLTLNCLRDQGKGR